MDDYPNHSYDKSYTKDPLNELEDLVHGYHLHSCLGYRPLSWVFTVA